MFFWALSKSLLFAVAKIIFKLGEFNNFHIQHENRTVIRELKHSQFGTKAINTSTEIRKNLTRFHTIKSWLFTQGLNNFSRDFDGIHILTRYIVKKKA